MMHADDVRASIKVCMFDQYGTVVDMQTGLTEAAAPFLAAKGWQGASDPFRELDLHWVAEVPRGSPAILASALPGWVGRLFPRSRQNMFCSSAMMPSMASTNVR